MAISENQRLYEEGRALIRAWRLKNPNVVFDAGDTFRQMLIDLGGSCGEIDYSTNRNGGHSCYFRVGIGNYYYNVRISDHVCNERYSLAGCRLDYLQATEKMAFRVIEGLREAPEEKAAETARIEAARAGGWSSL